MKSDAVKTGMQQAPHRSLFNALGMTAEEMKKPMVGIVSSYNEIVPGHMNLDKIVEAVKLGMWKVANDAKSSVSRYFAGLPVEVGAKTGSAQVASNVEADAVFVCFAPYDAPQIAMTIVVEGGASGSNLAQAAAEILDYYFSAEDTLESVDPENTLLR